MYEALVAALFSSAEWIITLLECFSKALGKREYLPLFDFALIAAWYFSLY